MYETACHLFPGIGEGIGGVGQEFVEGLQAVLEEELIGVEAIGEGCDGDFDGVSEEELDDAIDGGGTGGVGIKKEDDAVCKAAEDGDVLFGHGGAEYGDDVGSSELVCHDHVGVSFDDGNGACFDDALSREVESEEGLAL